MGEVEKNHKAEVSRLISELASAGSAALGIKLDDGCVERLLAYGRSVAHFPTAVKVRCVACGREEGGEGKGSAGCAWRVWTGCLSASVHMAAPSREQIPMLLDVCL